MARSTYIYVLMHQAGMGQERDVIGVWTVKRELVRYINQGLTGTGYWVERWRDGQPYDNPKVLEMTDPALR